MNKNKIKRGAISIFGKKKKKKKMLACLSFTGQINA